MIFSTYASIAALILGKTRPPEVIPSLMITVSGGSALSIKWDPVTDLDFEEYVVKVSTTNPAPVCTSDPNITDSALCPIGDWTSVWDDDVASTEIFRGKTTEFIYTGLLHAGTTYYFWVKAMDTLGIYSVDTQDKGSIATSSFTMSGPIVPIAESGGEVERAIIGTDVRLTWGNSASSQFTTNNTLMGKFNINMYGVYLGGELVKSLSTSPAYLEVDWLIGAQPTLVVVAFDTFGNFTPTGNIPVSIEVENIVDDAGTTFAEQVVNTSEIVGPNFILSWLAPLYTGRNGKLPTVDYIVKISNDTNETFETASMRINDGISVLATTIPITWGANDNITVYVASRDSAGNIGIPGEVSVDIINPGMPTLTWGLLDGFFNLTWVQSATGNLPIVEYVVSENDNILQAGLVNKYSELVGWQGARTFNVKAIDSAGNTSSLIYALQNVASPSPITTEALWLAEYVESEYVFTWNAVPLLDTQLPVTTYQIWKKSNLEDWKYIKSVSNREATIPVDWNEVDSILVSIIAEDQNAQVSLLADSAQFPVLFEAPKPVENTTHEFSGAKTFVVSWSGVKGSIPIAHYEVRDSNTGWGNTAVPYLKQGNVTRYTSDVDWGVSYGTDNISTTGSANKDFFIKAVDKKGNYGDLYTYTINVPDPSTMSLVTQIVVDNNIILKWDDLNTSSYDGDGVQIKPLIEGYEVLTCPEEYCTLASAITNTGAASTINATLSSFFEVGAGIYTYWVRPKDHAQRYGPASSISALVNQPPNYTLFNTLEAFATNNLNVEPTITAGFIRGTIAEAAYCEGVPGDPDTEANCTGSWVEDSRMSAIHEYVDPTSGEVFMPVDRFESWEEHFDYNNALTIEDLINEAIDGPGAIYLGAITPANSGARVDFNYHFQQWDLGAGVLTTAQIKASWIKDKLGSGSSALTSNVEYYTMSDLPGNVTIYRDQGVTELEPYDENTGLGWRTITSSLTGTAVLTQVRFIKAKFQSSSSSRNVVARTSLRKHTIDVREATEGGTAEVTVAATGVQVEFTKTFADVSSITVTADGKGSCSNPAYSTLPECWGVGADWAPELTTAVYDFQDIPNPTEFTVFLFDTNGNLTTGTFSWTAKGIDGNIGE